MPDYLGPYELNRVHCGHILDMLLQMPAESVQCIVTSPPYWGLRDYKIPPSVWGGKPDCPHEWTETSAPGGNGDGKSFRRDKAAGRHSGATQPGLCIHCGAWRGCLGLEPTPELYIEHMVTIFRELRRVLRKDGTCWLNLGDSYCGGGRGGNPAESAHRKQATNRGSLVAPSALPPGLKPKDLVGIPWRVAFALQADGWVLRSEIIWSKNNPMPESVRDRPTKSHEQIFLFSKAKWAGPEGGIFHYISDQDARWLALLLDTEGNICAKRARASSGTDHFGTQLSFANTSLELLYEAKRIISKGAVLKRQGKNAPVFYYQLSNRQAAALLYRLYPYLIVKKKQAALGIYLQTIIAESGQERRTKKGRLRGRLRDDAYTEELIKIWETMKSLNHFGIPDIAWLPEPQYGHWESAKYFYDQDAVREDSSPNTHRRGKINGSAPSMAFKMDEIGSGNRNNPSFQAAMKDLPPGSGRNSRTVWTIPTQPTPEAHFATFPEELPRRCIKAGTSGKGACPQCGIPWERVVEKARSFESGSGKSGNDIVGKQPPVHGGGETGDIRRGPCVSSKTTGWRLGCECAGLAPIPCIVLDPFAGTAKTGKVAIELGRKFIGFDISAEYVRKFAQPRLQAAEKGLTVKELDAGQGTLWESGNRKEIE